MANINVLPEIYFSGDKHFFHEILIRGFSKKLGDGSVRIEPPVRPMFSSKEEMNETIVERHNEVVRKPNSLVYELGDFALKCKPAEALAIRKRMTGQFYFVKGNHDQVAEKIPAAWVWMKDLVRIHPSYDGVPPIILCHYAMRVWHGSHKGSWQLYGHSHGKLPEQDLLLSFDVGVDPNNFYPVSLEQVIEKMKVKIPLWQSWKDKMNMELGW